MSRKANESARVLNFFTDSSLDKAETVYDLVRDVMTKRLAPAKAARRAKSSKAAVPKQHISDRGNGGVSADA
jgi:hypothetical protein